MPRGGGSQGQRQRHLQLLVCAQEAREAHGHGVLGWRQHSQQPLPGELAFAGLKQPRSPSPSGACLVFNPALLDRRQRPYTSPISSVQPGGFESIQRYAAMITAKG